MHGIQLVNLNGIKNGNESSIFTDTAKPQLPENYTKCTDEFTKEFKQSLLEYGSIVILRNMNAPVDLIHGKFFIARCHNISFENYKKEIYTLFLADGIPKEFALYSLCHSMTEAGVEILHIRAGCESIN